MKKLLFLLFSLTAFVACSEGGGIMKPQNSLKLLLK